MENNVKRLIDANVGDKVYFFNLLHPDEEIRLSKVKKIERFRDDDNMVRLYLNNGVVIHTFDYRVGLPILNNWVIYAADRNYLIAYLRELLQDNINALNKERRYEYA